RNRRCGNPVAPRYAVCAPMSIARGARRQARPKPPNDQRRSTAYRRAIDAISTAPSTEETCAKRAREVPRHVAHGLEGETANVRLTGASPVYPRQEEERRE